jgi:hypothetical protein
MTSLSVVKYFNIIKDKSSSFLPLLDDFRTSVYFDFSMLAVQEMVGVALLG